MRFEGQFLTESRKHARWWFESPSAESLYAHLREKKWRVAKLYRVEDGRKIAENVPPDLVGFVPAGFWIRYLCYFVDQVILSIVLIPLSFWNMLVFKNAGLAVLINIPILVYKPLMESFYGATLGKMLFGVRVIDEYGNRLTLEAAYRRFMPFLVTIVAGLAAAIFLLLRPDFQNVRSLESFMDYQAAHPFDISAVAGQLAGLFLTIDCLAAAFHGRKRAWHDQWAQSYCIIVPKDLTQESSAPAGLQTPKAKEQVVQVRRISLKPPEEK